MAALEAAPSDHVLWQIDRGITVGDDELALAERTLAAALKRHDGAVHSGERGLILMRLGLRHGFGDIPPAVPPQRLVTTHRHSLTLDPGDPYVWLRLAQSHLLRDGREAAGAAALSRALHLAPNERALQYRRLDLALLYWPQLGEDDRRIARADIRALAWHDVKSLIATTLRRHALAPVRQALLAQPELLRSFDRFYREALLARS